MNDETATTIFQRTPHSMVPIVFMAAATDVHFQIKTFKFVVTMVVHNATHIPLIVTPFP